MSQMRLFFIFRELILSELSPELVFVLKQRAFPTIPVTPEQVSNDKLVACS